MGCCNETGCTRKQPILVRRGALSGRWYVVTRYHEDGDGRVTSYIKHDVTDDLVRYLVATGWTPPGDDADACA